jgi:hypothetical protein
VIQRPEMIKKTVSISFFQTIGHLRVKIADAFGFHINQFYMFIKNKIADPDEDDDTYIREHVPLQQVLL